MSDDLSRLSEDELHRKLGRRLQLTGEYDILVSRYDEQSTDTGERETRAFFAARRQIHREAARAISEELRRRSVTSTVTLEPG